jgi:hypothetical protein
MPIEPLLSSDSVGRRDVNGGKYHELIEVLTAIAHYADACGEVSKHETNSASEQITAWVARIRAQVQRGGGIVKQLMELVERGN